MAAAALPPVAQTVTGRGLSEAEALARLASDGPNELPRQRRRTAFRIVLDVLREPMLALLLVGGIVYFALGDLREAVVLLVLAVFSVAITALQQSRSERAIETLGDLASPRALVVRDGQRRRIPGREVVRGDLVVLAEGDRVPADAWVIDNSGLQVDESLLTGESVPVTKIACGPTPPPIPPRPGGEVSALVYAGTLVVSGNGMCRVAATGARGEVGRIGRSLAHVQVEVPRLYRQTRRLVLLFAVGGIAASLSAVLLYGVLRGAWLEGALAGIALGMAMLPEEFPVVLTVFMAMGALRMSRVRVLARDAAAIEALGSATTLCTDKTGTLTQNRMSVAQLRLPNGDIFEPANATLPEAFCSLAELGFLASAPEPFDPMDIAFHEIGRERFTRRDRTLRHRYPLNAGLLAVSNAWEDEAEAGSHIVAAKGAPEAIAELCGLDAGQLASFHAAANAMAASGLRVLGVAEANWHGSGFPESQRHFDFALRGLVGLEDPLRPSVPDAMRECRSAGIRVVMITGDYPETARATASKAGIPEGEVVTGPMLAAMDDATLAGEIERTTIFARIMPEQKLRIVETLKAAGEIVAMTGDGVNDAPSLKAAHIGVAMGGRGTDVAREAASIVLLDDDFGSIVTAVRVGRRIYDNLRKAMAFIIAVHIPIAGLALMPLLLGWPVLLGPIHIALLEMIIDPVCSLVFEAEREESDVMRRPPRSTAETLLSRGLTLNAILQGAVALAVIAALLGWAGPHESPAGLRTVAFYGLVAAILALVLANRSLGTSPLAAVLRPNPALASVLAIVLTALCVAQLWPAAATILDLTSLEIGQRIGVVSAGMMLTAVLLGIRSAGRITGLPK